MVDLKRDVTVVIRSVGERTEARCLSLILAQGIPQENVIVVNERPFSRALAVGWTAAVAAGRSWTYCIDADVLLRPGSISEMVGHAERMPAHFAKVHGMMLDKLTFTLRECGAHLYRTSLLTAAIELIPNEGDTIRPETGTLHKLAAKGHPWARVPYVCGLHDFEQYNRDIFRKSYTHARKHLAMLPRLVPLWQKYAEEDNDFRVMLSGAAAGIQDGGEIKIDTRYEGVVGGFENANFAEKAGDLDDKFDPSEIEEMLRVWSHRSDVEVRGWPHSAPEMIGIRGEIGIFNSNRIFVFLRSKFSHIGVFRALILATGVCFVIFGQRIQVLARGNR